jgi:integrase
MAIFKRGRIYWYHFVFNGAHIQESTKQGNPRVARQMEAAHRTSLAKGEVGIRDKQPVPTLQAFIGKEFMPWVAATFKAKPNTFVWYRGGTRRICELDQLAQAGLDQVTGEKVAAYVAHRQARGLGVTAINRELQILRRILHLAVEWGRIERAAKIKMLPGEPRRERVLTHEEEKRYLAVIAEPLLAISTVLIDSGLRPEECFRLRWENLSFDNGRFGTMLVPHGKTPSARRLIPMSPRVREVLELRRDAIGEAEEGWVFPAKTKSGHVEPSTLRLQHRNALRLSGVRPFVLYTLRHTFLTRLGESGCDVWTLARIAGHSTIGISARYVHPSEEAVQSALHRLERQQHQSRALPAGTRQAVN